MVENDDNFVLDDSDEPTDDGFVLEKMIETLYLFQIIDEETYMDESGERIIMHYCIKRIG